VKKEQKKKLLKHNFKMQYPIGRFLERQPTKNLKKFQFNFLGEVFDLRHPKTLQISCALSRRWGWLEIF